jgi:hypothetical protein
MANHYEDVDLMLLKRWKEVMALRRAFDDLMDRMREMIETTLGKITNAVAERGMSCDYDAKFPSIWFWKKEWGTRNSKEPCIYFHLLDFAPAEYGKVEGNNPVMWLMSDDFSRLKFRENSEEFGRLVLASLSPELLKKWSHEKADLSDSPLGKDCSEVSESDRVALVSGSDALSKFVIERLDEFMELTPAVDQTLQKMTRR